MNTGYYLLISNNYEIIQKLDSSWTFIKNVRYQRMTCSYFSGMQVDKNIIINWRNEFKDKKVDILYSNKLLNSKEKNLFVFDMDSTLIEEEVIDELARIAGVYDLVAGVTREAMEGKLEFDDALKKRCSYLKGLPDTIFDEIYKILHLKKGTKELLFELKKRNSIRAVLSGGFNSILSKFSKDYEMDFFRGNELEISDNKLTGKSIGNIMNKFAKKETLIELSKKYNVSENNTVACGDGSNDALMIHSAMFGAGIHAKDGLKSLIYNWIDHNDISALLFLFEDLEN